MEVLFSYLRLSPIENNRSMFRKQLILWMSSAPAKTPPQAKGTLHRKVTRAPLNTCKKMTRPLEGVKLFTMSPTAR